MEVNGLYRHGFMIAPAMLDVVLELLDGGDSALARRFDVSVEHAPSLHRAAA
jgi:glycine oxidase